MHSNCAGKVPDTMLYLSCNSNAFSLVFTECIHVSQTAARGLDGRHIHNSLRGLWENAPLPIMICSGSDKAFPGFRFSAENFLTQKEKELGWMGGTHTQPLILDSFKSGAKRIQHQFDTPSSSRTGLVFTSTNNKRPPQWGLRAHRQIHP